MSAANQTDEPALSASTAESMLELLAQQREQAEEEGGVEEPAVDLRAKMKQARMDKRNIRTGFTRRKAIEEAGGAIKMKDAKKRARLIQQQNISEVWQRLGLREDEYPEVRQQIQLAMNRNNQQQLQQIVGKLVADLVAKRSQQESDEEQVANQYLQGFATGGTDAKQ